MQSPWVLSFLQGAHLGSGACLNSITPAFGALQNVSMQGVKSYSPQVYADHRGEGEKFAQSPKQISLVFL